MAGILLFLKEQHILNVMWDQKEMTSNRVQDSRVMIFFLNLIIVKRERNEKEKEEEKKRKKNTMVFVN